MISILVHNSLSKFTGSSSNTAIYSLFCELVLFSRYWLLKKNHIHFVRTARFCTTIWPGATSKPPSSIGSTPLRQMHYKSTTTASSPSSSVHFYDWIHLQHPLTALSITSIHLIPSQLHWRFFSFSPTNQSILSTAAAGKTRAIAKSNCGRAAHSRTSNRTRTLRTHNNRRC